MSGSFPMASRGCCCATISSSSSQCRGSCSSLVVTVLLFEEVPGWRFFRSVYYLPTILSAAVVGTLMRIMFTSQGAVNDVLGRAGLERQHDWLGAVSTAFLVLILAFYWQTLGQGVLSSWRGCHRSRPIS